MSRSPRPGRSRRPRRKHPIPFRQRGGKPVTDADGPSTNATKAGSPVVMVVAWLWVAVPFLYGLYQLAEKSSKLFE
ncbi:hypothetical protein GCM10009579_34940 [Streptomyces javensis]|uniref:Uncharacterized protein n=1 Tax=Streptomyces javensis TaxID=114698 RepID=A0ABN1X0X2_9ACTN